MLSMLGDMGEMFAQGSTAVTEIEIITKSGIVPSQTVAKFNLTTLTSADSLPVFGEIMAKISGIKLTISVSRFLLPAGVEIGFQITIKNAAQGTYQLTDCEETVILEGKVGKLIESSGYQLFIKNLIGENG
jgi:tyrosine-protein kinase Etk/Wzc